MTIYALRQTEFNTTLTEFKSVKELNAEQDRHDKHGASNVHIHRVDAATARNYVKRGGHHETALWVDNGKVRRASDNTY